MDHYDVIIIGSGAGGGTLAHRLAPSGKSILLLERGGYLPRELDNWDSLEVFGRDRYVTTERWYDKHGVPFRPHAQYFVGGNTKVYGGALLRLRERDFQEVKHHGGVSPPGPSPTPTSSRTTRRPNGSTSSTAGPARTPPNRRAPGHSHIPPSRTSRASSNSMTTCWESGTTRSTCRSGSTSTNPTPKPDAACGVTGSTAFRASRMARQTPTWSACVRPSSTMA